MVEAVILLASLIALGWVLLWSMLQEKVRPGEQLKGFFAMKHDLSLEKKATQENGDMDDEELGDDSAKLDWRAHSTGYKLPRGRYHQR